MILKRAAAEVILGRKIEAPACKKWYLLSADGTKNLGGYRTRKEVVARERAVQYFKHNPDTLSDLQLRSLILKFSSEQRKTDSEIISLIDSETSGRINMRALREGITGYGRWWFLTTVDPRAVDPTTHGIVKPVGDENLNRPIVIGSSGEVIDGRHRVMAARAASVSELPAWAPADFVHRQLTSNPGRKKKSGFLGKPHDWDEVLIDKDGKKLTRGKIVEHYKKFEKKIWPFLEGQTVLVYIGTGRNKSVLRRKGPDGEYIKLTKLKGIDDPHSLEYWTHRRVIEFHPVITGKTTPLVWVDLDPKFTKATEAKLKREMRAAIPRIKAVLRKDFGVTSPHVYSSGKRGIHIEGDLPGAKDANRLRRLLRAALADEFSDDKTFTMGIPKGGQIRLDTTLIKNLGSIRAPYSMSVMGRAKLPIKAKAKAKAKKKAVPRRRKNPDESSLFHVTYAGRLPGIVEDGLAPGRGPSIGGESYNWNRRDSIFLSESDGVSYWYDLASRWAFDSSDDPAGDGLVPVVLRISGGPLTTDLGFDELCEDDEVGWEDSNRPTYKCKTAIEPKHIQVWTGSSWVPVRRYGDIDLSSASDMDTWEDALMPIGKEMESGKKKANPRRRRKSAMRRRRRNPEVQELSAGQYNRLKALATDRKAHLWNEDPELEHIGIGGERIVYGLSVEGGEPFAFKVDQGTKLHRQTEFEVKCLVKSNNPLAPDILDWDRENYRWIEMELMTSLPDTDDPEAVFEEASGIDWDSWSFAFETYGGYLTDWDGVLKNLPTTPKAKRFIAMVRAFVADCELSTSELGLPDNWGVTKAGKLKPLDLGY